MPVQCQECWNTEWLQVQDSMYDQRKCIIRRIINNILNNSILHNNILMNTNIVKIMCNDNPNTENETISIEKQTPSDKW